MPKKDIVVEDGSHEMLPAIPPEDYSGSVADWMIALQSRGLWNGQSPEWHGDVVIPATTWWEILEECEGTENDELEEGISG